ncbi:MAG TPA: tRNA (guanosine(37)-N1)-methyltransferase TrmD [Cellvibrionaceae bacterium]|nr:tRNA (guanosine(37)-N1)-methyltransferase TrmD [Cellvibrionaceae bacterium]HMY37749.1 tRNA (guanosine(37)-N1)-methyltransferase TrmD [Marinagarivorans sp.]HNG59125.1 tRNA (guanosine(37)-N1)-methyltransferase TrmD [Cellvibrionaceae bacterium]
MNIAVLSLFPEMFSAFANLGVTGRAVKQGLIKLHCISPRDFAFDRHQTVDDRPFGGGPGMVMMVEPLRKALQQAKDMLAASGALQSKVIYLSPQGKRFDQSAAERLSTEPALIFVAGRYEGVDERFVQRYVDEEWSIGDYVLSGGELPAMVMVDAMARLLPGVLGAAESAVQDSFVSGLLDCPAYTRPEEYDGDRVPEVLVSGDHKKIANWRLQQSLGRTWERRPDLLEKLELSPEQLKLLAQYQAGRKSDT